MTDSKIPDLPIELADPKHWYASRAILGSLAVIAAQIAGALGIDLDAAALTELALQAVSVIGALVAIWGRVRAEQPIATPGRGS